MGQAFIKFFGVDWRSDPKLRLCSAAARGVWIDMITLMMEAEPFGHLVINSNQATPDNVAALCCTPVAVVRKALVELERQGVFSRCGDGTIYSRRMVRDAERSAAAREIGKRGGNPAITRYRGDEVNRPRLTEGLTPPVNRDDGIGLTNGLTGGVNTHGKARIQNPESRKIPPDPPDDLGAEFEEIWILFPRKVGKAHALKAYRSARRRADAETIRQGIQRFAEQSRGKEPQFVAHPATWLNGDRWLDEARSNGHAEHLFDPEDSKWRARLGGYRDKRFWRDMWGFPPGDPACAAPFDLLVEYGYGAENGNGKHA